MPLSQLLGQDVSENVWNTVRKDPVGMLKSVSDQRCVIKPSTSIKGGKRVWVPSLWNHRHVDHHLGVRGEASKTFNICRVSQIKSS